MKTEYDDTARAPNAQHAAAVKRKNYNGSIEVIIELSQLQARILMTIKDIEDAPKISARQSTTSQIQNVIQNPKKSQTTHAPQTTYDPQIIAAIGSLRNMDLIVTKGEGMISLHTLTPKGRQKAEELQQDPTNNVTQMGRGIHASAAVPSLFAKQRHG